MVFLPIHGLIALVGPTAAIFPSTTATACLMEPPV